MRNEADRYLRRVLEDAKHYITDAVIIDDASTDNSVAVCEEVLQGIPLTIIRNKESQFSNEITLRKQQWMETIKTNPDWIVFLDADEIFEQNFSQVVQNLVLNPSLDAYYFRLYDFWDENHYRDDKYWQAHNGQRIFLARYRPDIPYVWNTETPQHCGRFPSTVANFIGGFTNLRLKHYGWAKEEDRKAKFERYKLLDPDAKYGIKEQYDSILDPNPNLVTWNEMPESRLAQ
jgi:glycosyltransferase involved in cell wall biosynthesis